MYFIFYYNKKMVIGRVKWLRGRRCLLATKVDNLSPIPETHMVEKENLSL